MELKNNEENMTIKKISEKTSEETTSITTGSTSQENITKIEKMANSIIEKFGIHANIFKSGGRWSVMFENGNNIKGSKMKEIREYVISHSEELEEDDDI